jgi:hypothetical protein
MTHPQAIALMFPLFVALLPGQEQKPAPAPRPDVVRPATVSLHAELDRILKNHVRDGLVDYQAIRRQDQKALADYLDRMAKLDFDQLGRMEQFAGYIDIYNATMLQAVLDHTAKDPKWTSAANDFGVFKEPRVRLARGTITLDHLEHEILRPKFKDPRVHVALVCGARSCPPLLPRAYEAADLDKVLDANLHAFLHDGTRNQVDRATKTVKLSGIFEWFQKDFGGEAGVRKLLQAQFDATVASYRIEYLDYSWALNAATSGEAR